MSELIIKKRNLPHWVLEDVVYFITFKTENILFNLQEIEIVKNHIVDGNEKFYDLYAAVIMINHAHIILKPNNDFSLSRILKGIKGVSANKVNKCRRSTGQVWQDESYDRIIRDLDEFEEKLLYMFNNPIKAGVTSDTFKYAGWFYNQKLL